MTRFVKGSARGFVPDDLPDISDVELWDGPWRERLVGDVDVETTALLGSTPGNLAVRTTHGLDGYGGVPYQFAERTRTAVFTDTKVHGIKRVKIPTGIETRRTGDPAGSNEDRQAFMFEGSECVELSSLNPTLWGLLFGATLQVGSVSRWDLTQPWDKQGVKGTAAIKAPVVPHLATPEEFEAGYIGHAQMLAVTHYQPKQTTGYARGTDAGSVPKWLADDLRSPLVAGMRLRLTRERFERLAEVFLLCRDVITLLFALRDFGVVIADRTDPKQGHQLRLPQTGQIDLAGLALKITDFEIVR